LVRAHTATAGAIADLQLRDDLAEVEIVLERDGVEPDGLNEAIYALLLVEAGKEKRQSRRRKVARVDRKRRCS
jgi:hypothetical protein